nr:MAG TPA: hypothetical protein [Caudoviricetes sp.]DAQ12637.1 MAG TPA: hypothetical protein [Caudoviricetes sp.]
MGCSRNKVCCAIFCIWTERHRLSKFHLIYEMY